MWRMFHFSRSSSSLYKAHKHAVYEWLLCCLYPSISHCFTSLNHENQTILRLRMQITCSNIWQRVQSISTRAEHLNLKCSREICVNILRENRETLYINISRIIHLTFAADSSRPNIVMAEWTGHPSSLWKSHGKTVKAKD